MNDPDSRAHRGSGLALDPVTPRRLTHIWKKAYNARTRDDLLGLYAEWAESYDEDHQAIGFDGHVMAARGMGLTENQILLRIQLPLGVRTIMAGIRTSTVISIGVATLAAFIGAGGLGEPIITGLQLNDINLILPGAIPAALLAVLVDGLLGRLERLLAPPGVEAGPAG